MRAIVKVFVVGTLGLAMLMASAASWALPKKLMGGECNCTCKVAGEHMSGKVTGLANQFANCSAYNSKTCNVADPATGGVVSGKTESCCQVLDNGSCVDLGGRTVALQQGVLQNATLTTGAGAVTPPPSPPVAPTAPVGKTPATRP